MSPERQPARPADWALQLADPVETAPAVRGHVACPGTLVVGRKHTADIVLPPDDESASRLHFLAELAPAYCRLTNHSGRGTLVNGLLVQAQCDLRHGDLIRAGRTVLVVHLLRAGAPAGLPAAPTVLHRDEGDATSDAEDAPLPATPPQATLHVPGYQLIRQLGAGGMGNVWLAEDIAGRQAACKLIRPELALNARVCARFRRETTHLRDLRHRHIVGFREAGEAQGLLYLVMDYVPGSNLAEVLARDGPLAVPRAVRLACQVLDALSEAHKACVVHRDVKPSNVLVHAAPGGEECRLADFGLAKAYQSSDLAQALTLPGVMGGTMAFASPEMLTDFRQAGPFADQYGAAATLYHVLAGRGPHEAANTLMLLDSIRTLDPPPLTRWRDDVPPGLSGAIGRALAREPRHRFPTAQAFREALLPFAG